MLGLIYSEAWPEESGLIMNKKKFLEWVLIILIMLFFAIPLCSLIFNEPVTRWPTSSTHFLYSFLFK